MRGRLDLTGWRYLQGLLAGALTGGALTGAAMGGFYGFVSSAAPDSSIMSLYLGLTVAMVATCVWGAGLILVGTPLWAMFAAGGWCSRPVALGVGGGLSGLVGVGLGAIGGTNSAATQGLLLGAIGLAVAWVGWSVAYRCRKGDRRPPLPCSPAAHRASPTALFKDAARRKRQPR